ncbi:MAG TPA: protein kinase [Terracidiphilus sp.]|jgi:serine/threonine protein kinase/Flp pilus assembly protein TadD
MTPEFWERLNPLFNAAIETPRGERSAFIAEACGNDSELRRELVALIDAHEQPDSAAEKIKEHIQTLVLRAHPGFSSGDVVMGRFRIVRELGSGGMGDVYEALDLELSQAIALKSIRPEIVENPGVLARFRREVQLARRLSGPNVCRIHELFVIGSSGALDSAFLTMEFLDGITLSDRVKQTGPIPWREAQALANDICSGLTTIHDAGIIHRDLKGSNIMLADRNGFQRAVLMDFGLARELVSLSAANESGLTVPGAVMGTPEYMAPEQFEGKPVTPATDVYAMGVLLYEMVTAKCPFAASSPLGAAALRGKPPQPASSVQHTVPHRWDVVIRKCLEYDADRRYQSANELAEALNRNRLRSHRVVGSWFRAPAAGFNPIPIHQPASSSTAQKTPKNLRSQKGTRWAIIGFVAGILAALVAGIHYHRSHQDRRLSDKDTVVLADFANRTGEGVFDDTLKTALAISLNQSPFLNVLAENKVANIVKSMTRPADTPLTSEVAREVCERAGGKAFIAGSIAKLGNKYILGLTAVNCQNGDLVTQEQITANDQEKVLDALGKAASTLRGRLGESRGSVQKYDIPLADATTSSLQALQQLSLGRKWSRELPQNAEFYYQEAIKLDPNFAMAYHDLGRLYFALGEVEKGRASFKKAFDLKNRSSEREELEIRATYYEDVTGDLTKALFVRNEQVAIYPRDSGSFEGLGYTYILEGNYELAIEKFRQSIQLDAYDSAAYGLLANALISLQRFEEGHKIITMGQDHFPDVFLLHNALYGLAFLEANASDMMKEEHWMNEYVQYENIGFSLASDSEAYAGHLRKAGELTELAVDSSQHADSKETGAVWYENQALREAGFGNFNDARVTAARGLTPKPMSLGARVEAALAYSLAGDSSKAELMAKSLNEDFPSDTQVQYIWLPAIRAQVALNRKDPSSARDELRKSVPFEFGYIPFATNASCLYPTYIRGQAYLALGQGKLAAGEFQKILDHSGLVWNCWTGALAHLGLARANVQQANTSQGADVGAARASALSSYNDFFKLWKDADPKIPELKKAKSEYIEIARQITP